MRSESYKPCQFPFVWEGETYYSCTNKTGKFRNGQIAYGNPWCSTKTNPITNEHIKHRRYYGECKKESCFSGGKSYLKV